ncbi:MAG: hypothetical protein ACKVT1_17740 [Dehalococcoidia bacterium]
MELTTGQQLAPYRVVAHNGALHSDNKIHDNEVAKQYGFAGGLVPGVTVHAYMCRPLAEAFGAEWVAHGTINTRFLKPFYEGEQVTVEAVVSSVSAAGTTLDLRALNGAGELCGTGTASMPAVPAPAPALSEFPAAPLPSIRPFATRGALEAIDILGSPLQPGDAAAVEAFLAEAADTLPLWRGEGAVLHPGYIIRAANTILVQNVQLGPWIHVSSDVTHFAALRPGDGFSTRGRVTDLFERKGHSFVVLDLLMVAESGQPVVRVTHTAIYDVRKLPTS